MFAAAVVLEVRDEGDREWIRRERVGGEKEGEIEWEIKREIKGEIEGEEEGKMDGRSN